MQGCEEAQLSPGEQGLAEAEQRAPFGQGPALLEGGINMFKGIENNFQIVQKEKLAGKNGAAEEGKPGDKNDG